MHIDQKKREELGLPAEDYYKRESQKVYALLHAVIVRRISILKQKGANLDYEDELISEVTKITQEEIEKVVTAKI
jgi:hypothetical protein